MRKALTFILASLFLFACEKSLFDEDFSAYNYIDINNDSIDDYLIYYWGLGTTDMPQTGAAWHGEIQTLDSNSFLFSLDDTSYFLSPGDLITNLAPTNKIWRDSTHIDLLAINKSNGNWDQEWTCQVDSLDEYYLGIKYATESGEEIGWMKLSIDTELGKISVEQKENINSNELVLDI